MMWDYISRDTVEKIVSNALNEDIGHSDITTSAIIPEDEQIQAFIIFKGEESCVLCGVELVKFIFNTLSPQVDLSSGFNDGDIAGVGERVLEIDGLARTILMGERVSLNFLCRLTGIATLTVGYVEKVSKDIRVCDTRKTTPGIRALEKYAVRCGGGYNHRFSLEDGILIKDNHIRIAGSIKEAVKRARQHNHHLIKIEVEAQSIEQVKSAIESGVDVIMLDNFSVKGVKDAIELIDGRAEVEVSGGINHDNIGEYSRLGIDYISIGSLTHQAVSLDFSLEVEV